MLPSAHEHWARPAEKWIIDPVCGLGKVVSVLKATMLL